MKRNFVITVVHAERISMSDLEEKMELLKGYVPVCTDRNGDVTPVMYHNNPTVYCPYNADCSYKAGNDYKEKICTYYETMSLMFEKEYKQLELNFDE